MRVLITGATGLIGRALVPILRGEGHQLIALVRSEERARSLLGAEVETVELSSGVMALREALEPSDAVVNLAGESIMGGRWTEARRRVLVESRVQLTKQLVSAIAEARPRLPVTQKAAVSANCNLETICTVRVDYFPQDGFGCGIYWFGCCRRFFILGLAPRNVTQLLGLRCKEEVVARSGTDATGFVSARTVGEPAPARSAGVVGPTEPYDRGVDASDRAGSGEVS